MKLFLSLLTVLFLNQNSFASGATGNDPNAEMPSAGSSEAGSVAIAAVGAGGQRSVCVTCGTNGSDSLAKPKGTLNSSNIGSIGKSGSTAEPVKTGQ